MNANKYVDPVYGAKRPNTVLATASLFMILALQVNLSISKFVSDGYQVHVKILVKH